MLLTGANIEKQKHSTKKMVDFLYFLLKKVILGAQNGVFSCF